METLGARQRWSRRAYTVLITAYVAGLLLWLGVGLLPPLVSAVGPLRTLALHLAASSGALRDPASEVLMHLPGLRSGLWACVQYLFSGLNLFLALLLAVRRPHDAVARLLTLAFAGTAATFNEASHTAFHVLGKAEVLTAVHFTFHVVSGVAYAWAVLLFPDGRLPWRRATPFAVAGTVLVAFICWRSSFIAHPPFFVAFFGVLVPVVGIAAQTTRLARGASGPVRQQARLLRISLAPALAAAAVWLVAQAVGAGSVTSAIEGVFPALFALVPVVLFVAILRYRLWDMEVVLSRTLLLGLLAAFVAAVYAVVLGATGWLLRGSTWSAVLAMAVVALAVEPVRDGGRRLVNRLVFGQEQTPRQALRDLADRLTRTGSGDQLADLARVVVTGTRCTAAAVWLVLPDRLLLAARTPVAATPDRVVLAADDGRAVLERCREALPGDTCLPVVHEGRLLGVLAVREPAGSPLPAAESRLLSELAGHAGLLVANAQLTGELAEQVARVSARGAELRASRQSVVRAQDAERRRLERDIHDGAQQELVAFLVQAGVLQRLPQVAPEHVAALRELVAGASRTLADLATGSAPAVLVSGGLPAALDAAAVAACAAGLAVEVRSELDRPLPLPVAAAAYFCCREALQNAAKHARADRVVVEAHVVRGDVVPEAEELVFAVTDDGVGVDPQRVGRGSGAGNLRERLAALGGSAEVVSRPGSGTCVRGRLPLPAREPEPARVLDLTDVPVQGAAPAVLS